MSMQRAVESLKSAHSTTTTSSNGRAQPSMADASTAPSAQDGSMLRATSRVDRVATLKPSKFEVNMDFESWWPSFTAYAECQAVQVGNINAFLLGFMGESAVASVRRSIKGTEYGSFDALYEDMKMCFAVTDVSAPQLLSRFSIRDQFSNESLTSYYNDLWDWVERIDKVRRFRTSMDEEVKTRFVEGLHDRFVQAKLSETEKRFEERERAPLQANEALRWAKEISADTGLQERPVLRDISHVHRLQVSYSSAREDAWPAKGGDSGQQDKRAVQRVSSIHG